MTWEAGDGRLDRDVESRTAQSGRPWARATVGVGTGESTTWLNVALFGVLATEDLVGRLKRGASVYIERRDLGVARYTTQSGEKRVGLKAVATKIELLGLIGRAKPAMAQTPPEGEDPAPVAAGGSRDWRRPLTEDAIPFEPCR